MKTQKVETRFMQGHKDLDCEIFSLVSEDLGIKKAMELDFDFDNAIYSDNFIKAVESGLTPDFSRIYSVTDTLFYGEFHHAISNDECFVIYFK